MTDARKGKIVAPWNAETAEALNAYQVAGVMHPFTCARDSQHGAGLPAGYGAGLDIHRGQLRLHPGLGARVHDHRSAFPPSSASVAPQPEETE